MFLERRITHQFDGLIDYTSQINRLSGGTATALVIIQNGHIITEHYEGFHGRNSGARRVQPDSQFNVASARKSYIGFAVALAVYEGKISSIDDLVTDYLPDLDGAIMANTTIRHLLTHTHGVDHAANRRLYREFDAGTNWAYRGANIIMLTDIVRRTMGQTVSEILQQRVFYPLGFMETGWRNKPNDQLVHIIRDGDGDEDGLELGTDTSGAGDQTNLYVSAQEFAYWGYLNLRRGNIGGEQIIPKEIFELATSVQSPPMADDRLPQHGFLWYVKERSAERTEIGDQLPRGTFQIVGMTGPLLLVIPEHDMVVARMYNQWGNYGGPDGTEWLRYFREFGDRVITSYWSSPHS